MKGYRCISCPVIGEGSTLSFFEHEKELSFTIKRIYYITGLEQGEKRGFHAHKKLKQVLFCPYGSIEVLLKDGTSTETITLDSPEKLLILDGGLWREFSSCTEGSVLCVGASETYSESDYIRDYNEYLQWVNNENPF